MENRYKIIISNRNLYKEVELPVSVSEYKVGTEIECDYRLYKELFFEAICLTFINNNGKWSMMCSDNLYITTGDTKRLLTVELKHGDYCEVIYQDTNTAVFHVEFSIAFDHKHLDYRRKIDTSGMNHITIGSSSDCNIIIKDELVQNEKIVLNRDGDGYIANIISSIYGINHNGNKMVENEKIVFGDFISISNFSFCIRSNSIWTEISPKYEIVGMKYTDYEMKNHYPKFVRNTRVKHVLSEEQIEVLDPPEKPQKPKTNIVTTLLSSLSMLVVSGVMAYMGGTTMIIFSGVSAVMAVITSVVGIFQGKKEYRVLLNERSEKYKKYIDTKRLEIENIRQEELTELYKIYYVMDVNIKHFSEFAGDLFDRIHGDDDFLHVCLGKGDIEAKRKINYKKKEKLEIEDELSKIPEKLYEDYRLINNAPVCCDFNKSNAVGIIGKKDFCYDILKTIVVDICARHFYSDVKFVFIVNESNQQAIERFRMLPYVNNEELNRRNIVCDEESKKIIFEYFYGILSERERKKSYDINYVIFLYDLCGFMSHPISRYIEKGTELGVTFVFFAPNREEIPKGCSYLIEYVENDIARLVEVDDAAKTIEFQYEKISDKTVDSIVKMLSPVHVEEVSLEGSLTKNINLFKLLNILDVEDLNLKKRWAESMVYKSMSVPLGVSKTGIVYLDLHDKAHGPHGLVAGTTGSGKSEILQSYILSVATFFHPYEIAFLIIDFKGGGMVNQFRELPHLLGAITNIDGKEIDRSLKSIKAELQKRQRLFAEAGVNHIDKYIKKYKSHEVETALPHLIIIVDEFAELKAEQPEFMKELISAARIGRSLGVHLILATQKPAGQVDDQIWSNSRFKLCLKVQGPEDSNEVLKSPLAAEIKEPGRAYLQVGNNEIFELFQSAYSGASEKNVDDEVKEYKLWKVDLSGKRNVIYEQKKKKEENGGRNQLEAIVDYVNTYCEKNSIQKLPNICMEALKSCITFEEKECDSSQKMIEIGIYDDPDNQYQGKMFLDIENKHTFVVGSAQYGKTNLLQLIIREIALKKSVTEANIYILDFGSMVLKNFEKLHHVGGVICSSEDEKLKNFIKLLAEEVTMRKERLVAVGVSSFNAYCDAGYTDLPHIYVLIDNMTALMELYLAEDDSFLAIIRESLAVGISCIVVNAQTSGIGYRYLSNFANKIALYNNDSNEYGNIFDHVMLKPEDIPGRCVMEYEKVQLECQIYLAFEGEKEIDRVSEIREFIDRMNKMNPDNFAKQIPYIPAILQDEQMEQQFHAFMNQYRIPIGLTYSGVEPYYINLASIGALGICGKEKRGHFNFISNLLISLEEQKEKAPVKVCIYDDVSRKYKAFQNLNIVEKYTIDTTSIIDVLAEWHRIAEERYQNMILEKESEERELLLLIIQNNDVAKRIYEDMDAMNQYIDLIDRFKGLNIGIIFSNFNNASVSYDAPEPLRRIKQDRHLLYFDDLDNLKVFDIAYDDIKANRKKVQNGDAYYIDDDMVIKLKLKKSSYQY